MGNTIANKITEVSKNSQQNNSETVTNEHDKEIPKTRCISPEKKTENDCFFEINFDDLI